MTDIHVHIERPSPRARYIVRHLLGRMTGWEMLEVEDVETFRGIHGPKLVYGTKPVSGAFHIVPEGLLDRHGTALLDPITGTWGTLPVLFPVDQGRLPFDPFSAAFFLLSRYEEVAPIARDAHGRPVTQTLHSARNGYLQRPIVDEWLIALAEHWRTSDPRLPALKRTYSQVATLDVDNGAMYTGREWWRSIGGAARDLLRGRAGRVSDRIATLMGRREDPYAVHGAFAEMARRHGARAIVNFLVARRGRFDHAVSAAHASMRACIRSMDRQVEVGIHPSYGSSDRLGMIAAQKSALENIIGHAVTVSRQHFLRFRSPTTFRELERLGIREEHSMGMPDNIGFRAGTCTPYPFYDLGSEEETSLMIHPFTVMDSALAYGMRLAPGAAVVAAQRMADAVRRVGGTFISVWHERFLSGYGDEAGWDQVAERVMNHARP
jgi:hypothetical protein